MLKNYDEFVLHANESLEKIRYDLRSFNDGYKFKTSDDSITDNGHIAQTMTMAILRQYHEWLSSQIAGLEKPIHFHQHPKKRKRV